jgi:cysteine sulfinate desulfinase/cysteine desulfurase-like protein
MGVSADIAKSSLRFSIGLPTTEAEIDLALSYLQKALPLQKPHSYP